MSVDRNSCNTRDRCVQVSPGPDGTTTWWAQLPAAASAAAWSAITTLGATYAEEDPSLTVDQARADAFVDLMLSGVQVSAKVTIGLPVVTGPEADRLRAEVLDEGREVAVGGGGGGAGGDDGSVSISAALSGCELPGIGWVTADTVSALLSTVPLEVGRALLDAPTGTLVETTSTDIDPGIWADIISIGVSCILDPAATQ